ncbi:MAG TPA: protein kinase [Thermoanaerobaculia bacterium]
MPAPSDLPQRIGPYRILERLGAGGMGEVFLAYDERLDRRVAVKRIRPDAEVSADRRERFRREAKLAARLSHPAIVQVYDILQEGEFDYIVLEYVEGTSLWEVIEDGPMDVHETLDLARELADGLDAAHRQGIIHRDLKAENVLVTPSGRPKITDFGIAKELLGSDESLTRANAVLGTYRIMSPEQARGEAVDHRTDLFALGVLLYEMLTGRSPFAAENGLATLNRVIHFQQKPVREINPAVPEELSSLVDHLLQKDPALRPRGAGQVRRELDRLALVTADYGGTATIVEAPPLSPTAPVAGATIPAPGIPGRPSSALTALRSRPRLVGAGLAVLAALAAAAVYFVSRAPQEPLYVGVLRPEIGTGAGNGEVELLASGVRVALLQGLVSLERISPKAFEELDAVDGPPRAVARAASADEVISSRLDCRLEACRISLNRLSGQSGSVLWAESFEVPTDNYYLSANAVASQIRRAYAGHRVRKGDLAGEVSSEDLKDFLRLRQRFDSRRDADLRPILDEAEAIRKRSPLFLDIVLFEADVARSRFSRSRDPRDLEHAFDLVRQARKLAPDHPQPLFTFFQVALEGGRIAEAEEALGELQRLAPGDVRVLELRALLLNSRGESRQAIELLRTAARRNPSWKRLVVLARMELQNGQIAVAREHLGQLLERSPENFEGLSLLAQIELANGSPARAAELYERLVRRSPGLSQISNLGLAYFLLGRYAEAAESFRRVVEREPRNPFYLLNLADAYALMGREEEARAAYQRVVELIAADPSASTPQFLTVKAQAFAHLGQAREAVEAVQEASRIAPGDGAVAYEASLVYAVLGENASAIVSAEKALELGYEPRWFFFPWFDRLRADPHFQNLLRQKPGPA